MTKNFSSPLQDFAATVTVTSTSFVSQSAQTVVGVGVDAARVRVVWVAAMDDKRVVCGLEEIGLHKVIPKEAKILADLGDPCRARPKSYRETRLSTLRGIDGMRLKYPEHVAKIQGPRFYRTPHCPPP